MLRPFDLLMIGLLLGAAAFTFKIKQDSEAAIERVADLERQIAAERDAIDVLEADWSLLVDPARIAKLVERYQEQLKIAAPSPEAIGEIEEIPMRPPSLSAPQTTITDLLEGAQVDDTATGSVAIPQRRPNLDGGSTSAGEVVQ